MKRRRRSKRSIASLLLFCYKIRSKFNIFLLSARSQLAKNTPFTLDEERRGEGRALQIVCVCVCVCSPANSFFISKFKRTRAKSGERMKTGGGALKNSRILVCIIQLSAGPFNSISQFLSNRRSNGTSLLSAAVAAAAAAFLERRTTICLAANRMEGRGGGIGRLFYSCDPLRDRSGFERCG